MKNTLIKKINNLKPLFFAVILLAGFIIVSANNWSAPIAGPTSENSSMPINQGTSNQEKKGVLVLGGLVNTAYSPVVTYSPFIVGDSNNAVKTSFYGNLNLFNLMDPNTNDDKPLCTMSDGKVKICSEGVLFEPVKNVYYTDLNDITFPTSTGVTGAVKYNIDQAVSCTTVASSGTDWGDGTTLTESNNSYSVIFYDWGKYDLQINCSNGKSYTSTIFIKGKIKPTVYSQIQKFLFTSDRTLEIKTQAGGAASGGINGSTCYGGSDGEPSFAHVTTSSSWSGPSSNANVVYVSGGSSPYGTCAGYGGTYIAHGSFNTKIIYTKIGGSAYSISGGLPGSGGGSNSDGAGGFGSEGLGTRIGGGGGAYSHILYGIKTNEYIYLYQGSMVGYGSSAGKQGSITVEWY